MRRSHKLLALASVCLLWDSPVNASTLPVEPDHPASPFYWENSYPDDDTFSGDSIPGGIPDYGSILSSSQTIGGVSIEDIWSILQSQTTLPDYGSIFSGSSAPGSIPPGVWDIMQSQSGIFSGGTYTGQVLGQPNGIILNLSGASQAAKIPQKAGVGVPTQTNGAITVGQNTPVAGLPTINLPEIGQSVVNSVRNIRFPQLPNINPFRRLLEWSQNLLNNPLSRAISSAHGKIRQFIQNPSLGIFTRNPVVKARDQANLFDQELARLMAEPRLGEAGAQWMQEESAASMAVLQGGMEGANIAVQLATEAQALTSTQDVAKSVAQIGGQNALLSAAVLQMQGQSQASLLQLQQLTATSIQLAANASEGTDEANRRSRIERANALNTSASETIHVPGTFSKKP